MQQLSLSWVLLLCGSSAWGEVSLPHCLSAPASISQTLDMLSHSISLLSIDFLHADFRHPTAITYMAIFLGQCATKNEALSLSQ